MNYITRRRTNEEFIAEVKELVNDEYTFLDEYDGVLTKIRIKHNKCGHVYLTTPNSFINGGSRCNICKSKEAGIKKTKDTEWLKQEVYKIAGDDYSVIGEYHMAKYKVKLKHNVCGNTFDMTIGHFRHGERCPKCSYKKRDKQRMKTQDEFKRDVLNTLGPKYTVIGEYRGDATPIEIKHSSCGKSYFAIPSAVKQMANTCPYCRPYHGEGFIMNWLDHNRIEYEVQKKFPNLRDSNPLSYDFFIPNAKILIEYQGIQHFRPTEHFGGVSSFKVQKRHDDIKREYALANGYTLIEIPYTYKSYDSIATFLSNVINV